MFMFKKADRRDFLPDVGDEWLPYLWLDGQAGLTQSLTSEDTIVCLEGLIRPFL